MRFHGFFDFLMIDGSVPTINKKADKRHLLQQRRSSEKKLTLYNHTMKQRQRDRMALRALRRSQCSKRIFVVVCSAREVLFATRHRNTAMDIHLQ